MSDFFPKMLSKKSWGGWRVKADFDVIQKNIDLVFLGFPSIFGIKKAFRGGSGIASKVEVGLFHAQCSPLAD